MTGHSPSPADSHAGRGGERPSGQRNGDETRHDDGEADDNGAVIKSGTQEISRDDDSDDADHDGTASARVRFEIDGAAVPRRNGTRRENDGRRTTGIVDDGASVPRRQAGALTLPDNLRGSAARLIKAHRPRSSDESERPLIIVRRACTARANGAQREANDAEVGEDDANANQRQDERDDSRIAGDTPAVTSVVKHLVESR